MNYKVETTIARYFNSFSTLFVILLELFYSGYDLSILMLIIPISFFSSFVIKFGKF